MHDPAIHGTPQPCGQIASPPLVRQDDEHPVQSWAQDAFKIAVWTLNLQTGERYWSRQARELLGIDPSVEVDWAAAWANIHPADSERIVRAFSDVTDPLGTGQWHGELRLVHPQHGTRWLESHVRASFAETTEGRRALQIHGAIRDNTERKQTEERLRMSEARYRTMVHTTANTLWRVSADGEALLEVEGGTIPHAEAGREPVTKWLLQYVHPDDQEETLQLWRHAVSTKTRFDYVHRSFWPAGESSYVRSRGAPLLDAQGNVCEWVGTTTDITGRKRAEQALRESEERYRTLFESIDEGFCVIEVLFDANNVPHDYRFLEINPAFEKHTGLQQAVGKTARELLPTLEAYWFETYGHVALTGEPTRFENGSVPMQRWFDVYAFRVGQPEQRKVAILFNDITKRKQVEAEAERLFAAEQAARAEAEAAVRVRDQFLAIASHELRNPLTSVQGYATMLQRSMEKQVTDARTDRMVQMIIQQTQRLHQMIEHLLDVSRLQQGQFEVQQHPLELNTLVQHIVDTFRISLAPEEQERTIMLFPSPQPLSILGDSARLEEVFANLLSNAVKYSPSGRPITLRIVQEAADAVVEVTDQGIGIPSHAQPHLFQPFYRAQNVGSETKGFGIGLYVVHEIVQRHGGRIEIQSAPEKGSTFRVVLPLSNQT